MDEKILKEQLENNLVDEIYKALVDYVDDVTNLNIDLIETELNEILSATIEGVGSVTKIEDLDINENGEFSATFIVIAHLELSDYFGGETISESVEAKFQINCYGDFIDGMVENFDINDVDHVG